jgi:tungstate transport system ATP-binding protein
VDTLLKAKVAGFFQNLLKISVENFDGSTSFIYAAAGSTQDKDVMLAIRPEDVILYKEEIDSKKTSAMNLFKGKVIDITDVGIYKKVELDCGFRLCSFVTANSVKRLEIELNKTVYASIKASSIHLFKTY